MTDRPEDLAGTLRRIEKLLAIAQDERADPNEASAAAGLADGKKVDVRRRAMEGGAGSALLLR